LRGGHEGLTSAGSSWTVVDFCREDGLIVGRSGGGQRYSNTITLSLPLVITRGEIDRIVETLDRGIAVIPAAMVS
jgi:4-aminobutyrate aminotransferase-like enzyme